MCCHVHAHIFPRQKAVEIEFLYALRWADNVMETHQDKGDFKELVIRPQRFIRAHDETLHLL
jgi:hypothetical protein